MSVMVHISRETTKCVSTTCLLLATLLASFSVPGYPQTQLASVLGTVTDASGAVVSDAHVTFHNKSTGLKRDASTDLNGQYRVTGLSTGSYSARVEKEGFQTQVREELALTSASEFLMNLSLTVGDLKQEVTVRADVPTIDNSTSTVGGLLPEHTLTELPLNGRDLFKAAVLEPGVAPAPNSAP